MADDLSLILTRQEGPVRISGWTDIRLTRGMEQMPNDFEIGMTELYPGEVDALVIHPGDACKVMLGDDLLLTGYIDRFAPRIDARGHSIRVSGRGKCQDFVDCSAEWPNSQIGHANTLDIANKLGRPYGIAATAPDGAEKPVPLFQFMWGETAYDVLERACRFAQLLAYEGPDGNILLRKVGTARHASGIEQGKNVQAAEICWSLDQRYSDYVVRRLSLSSLTDLGDSGDIMETVRDGGVPRHRLRYIVAENGGNPPELADARGKWEMARRYGRSCALFATVDSWRDNAGMLWTPNMLVPLSLPALKLDGKSWLIGDVTYMRNAGSGTTAHLRLMPPEAFAPEPILLTPFQPDIGAALQDAPP